MSVLGRRAALALLAALAWPRRGRAAEPHELARFATTFATDAEHKARAQNVALAAEAIDGKVIAPGATLSFNDAVGERTAAFGFAKATVLRDGMLAEGMGGGTCQVASTLHAAALLAGLDVVSRAPHSRPSAYIRMGLDATVAFGSIDLKLKNPWPEPVTIRAHAAKGTLTIMLLSEARTPEVSLTSEIVERLPFPTQIERDPTLADAKLHVKTWGIPGFRVRRTRLVDGRRDVRVDTYAPVSAVLRVAPGVDVDPSSEAPAEVVADAAAVKPALVQARPSTLVTLDNAR